MKLQSFEKTDDLRRLALQLALQLPESVEDARRVLAMTGECLDDFLIEKAVGLTPWQRAKRLGWRLEAAALDVTAPASESPALSVPRSVCWALGTLLVSVPLSILLIDTAGAGAGGCFGFAVILVSMIFGVGPALVLACISPIVHNLLVLPPTLSLQAPSGPELIYSAFYVFFALVVPPLMRRLDRLRRLAALPFRPRA